jgi:RNA polymerase sigma-70 factor (ECF subfamily)
LKPRIDSREQLLADADDSAGGSEQSGPGAQAVESLGGPAGLCERELIEAAKQDPRRFAALYEENFGRVYGFIARRVRDRATAEDLTADVFHQALASLPRFEWRGAPFGAWLIRIASNAIVDRSKRAAKEQEILIASQAGVQHLDDSADRVQAGLEETEYYLRLFRLVDDLPDDQRRVIAMRFGGEKSIREIARELGRTEGAVKQLQFRGLQTLRARMGELGITI